jgi:hypothetical protein
MSKAERTKWEKEVEVDPQQAKACGTYALHRTTLLREKENVEFILNNETFELAEEEISPVPSHLKKRGPKSPLRLETLDVSVIDSSDRSRQSRPSLSVSMATSFIDPPSPAADISLIVPARPRASASTSSRKLAFGPPDPLTPAADPPKCYSRRSRAKPTCKLSTVSTQS